MCLCSLRFFISLQDSSKGMGVTDLLSADLLDLKLAMNRSVSPLMQKLKQVIVGVYFVLRIDLFYLRYSYSLRNQMLFVLFLEQLCLSFVVCYHIS